jgi:hypothetical protein
LHVHADATETGFLLAEFCTDQQLWITHAQTVVFTKLAPVAFAGIAAIKGPALEAPGMSTKKPELNEILEMCETAQKLIKAVFTAREQKKGDRNKWRGKARRLLRKISESI